MKRVGFAKRLQRIGVTATSLLMLGSASTAFAQRGGGSHGGGFHGGGFHGGGFHSGGFHSGGFHSGGFHGGGFHGGGFHGGGFHGGGGFGGFHGGLGYHGSYGYRGFRPYRPGWGPWWGLGLGLYLPVLPWYYTTFWWGGVPYYDVENDYYVWDPDAGEYQQVQPPPQVAQQAQAGQLAQAPPQLYAYPKKGQTAQQQATDKRDCSSWASAQTGLNPPADATATPQIAPANGEAGNPKPHHGGTAANANTPATAQQWQNYLRAEGACLEARGYTVE
jgi:hypothetical protein